LTEVDVSPSTSSSPVRVSVVVAAHDVEQYVGECLESLLACTGCDLEVVVVDDASSDATADLVAKHFGARPNVQLVRLGDNHGPSHARNVGIAAATGQWLAWVDADDWCESRRFAVLLDLANRYGADVVSDDQYIVEDGFRAPWSTINRVSGWKCDERAPVSFESFVRSRHIVKPLIKRSFLAAHGLSFYEEVRHAEDFLLLCELLVAGAKWHMHPAPMYHYRIRKGSLTNTGKFADGNVLVLERLLELDGVTRNPRYADVCRQALEKAERQARVRDARAALRNVDLPVLRRLAWHDESLFWSIFRHELALAPLRLRRRLHRLRFG
jgi:succinoglycan biosynthesis protein ExoO